MSGAWVGAQAETLPSAPADRAVSVGQANMVVAMRRGTIEGVADLHLFVASRNGLEKWGQSRGRAGQTLVPKAVFLVARIMIDDLGWKLCQQC